MENNLLGLNSVTWDVEWVAHYISERVVQFSEHLKKFQEHTLNMDLVS